MKDKRPLLSVIGNIRIFRDRYAYIPAYEIVTSRVTLSLDMAIDLQDRVIVITGASSGIGAATAVACAHAGMDVVIAARRKDRLAQVAQKAQEFGRRVLPVVCDVANDDDVHRLIETTMAQFGRLDVLFANAGVSFIAPVLETPDDQLRRLFEINFFGTLRCIHAAAPAIRQTYRDAASMPHHASRRGHILICSSCVSEIGLPMYGAYCATKAAQDSIAQALRAELTMEPIYVSSVHPVTTRTELIDQAYKNSPTPKKARRATHRIFEQSPQHVAKSVVRCLQKPCPEVWPHRLARFGLAVCTAFPRIAQYVTSKLAKRMMDG